MDAGLLLITGILIAVLVMVFLLFWCVLYLEESFCDRLKQIESCLYGERKWDDDPEFKQIQDLIKEKRGRKK